MRQQHALHALQQSLRQFGDVNHTLHLELRAAGVTELAQVKLATAALERRVAGAIDGFMEVDGSWRAQCGLAEMQRHIAGIAPDPSDAEFVKHVLAHHGRAEGGTDVCTDHVHMTASTPVRGTHAVVLVDETPQPGRSPALSAIPAPSQVPAPPRHGASHPQHSSMSTPTPGLLRALDPAYS